MLEKTSGWTSSGKTNIMNNQLPLCLKRKMFMLISFVSCSDLLIKNMGSEHENDTKTRLDKETYKGLCHT